MAVEEHRFTFDGDSQKPRQMDVPVRRQHLLGGADHPEVNMMPTMSYSFGTKSGTGPPVAMNAPKVMAGAPAKAPDTAGGRLTADDYDVREGARGATISKEASGSAPTRSRSGRVLAT